ncbi:protein TMEPAI-like isoform X1 [Stegodyphus dumicola]|uniref:protein TMEPAI-like isoform X1 n=1 Tax=Stegodyphus dumicola TaxID=202533 RepID=UPI0015A87319|nr:protein TMEPAI-like isoform X1 [Stegodyphus dumicola]
MPTAFCCCLGYRSGPLYSQVVPLHISARSYMSAVQIFIIVITVLLAVGIITCVLSHYKMGARSWSDQRNRQQSTRQLQQPCPQQQQYTYSLTPTTSSMMYTPATVQERQRFEAGAHQDHLVRLHSVQTDLALNLPHSIALPDGEEGPRCDTKFLKLQDPEQHAEITRSFIRPPPNRTVPDGSSLPPFRSNSVGLLQKPSTPPLTQTDTAVLVTRSHSVSSSNAQGGKLGYPRGQCTPVSNPNVSSHIWLPSSVAMNSRMSGTSGNSNRTYGCTQVVTDSKYDSTDPPPPYSDVVNQWDINTVSRQQNSDV